MITTAGKAGFVSQSGAVIRTAHVDTQVADGLPVKLVDGKAVELAAGDSIDSLFGIVVRRSVEYGPVFEPDLIGVLDTGYIHVPVAEAAAPVQGGAVYYDPENHVFTSEASSTIKVRARFAVEGQADGVAEIEVLPLVPGIAGSAAGLSQANIDEDKIDDSYAG